jgi:predicted nucleotidyltransferase
MEIHLMSNAVTAYIAAREELLARLVTTLQADERFVAAWLAGSFGRGNQDSFSDLDLHVVIADAYSESLCARPMMHGGRTTAERLALFKQFGEPAVIYEAHENAPEDGTFTYVLYHYASQNVDWVLIPQSKARRPAESLVLFEKVEIPVEPPPPVESLEERITLASDMTAFFWMMAANSTKSLLRNDIVHYYILLDWLHDAVNDVERAIEGRPWQYHRGASAAWCETREEQVATLRRLCARMLELMPRVVEVGGYVPASPMQAVELRLQWIDSDS